MLRQKAIIFVVVFSLVVCTLSVFALADSYSFPVLDFVTNYTDGYYIGWATYSGVQRDNYVYVTPVSDNPNYTSSTVCSCAFIGSGVWFFSNVQNVYVTVTNGVSDQPFLINTAKTTDNGTVYYSNGYRRLQNDHEYSSDLLVFNSVDDACEAFADFLLNPPSPPVEPSTFSFSIPAGYVAYIEYASSGYADLDITCQMPELSTAWIAGPEPSFWPSDLTYFGVADDLPANGDFVPYLSWTDIRWGRGEDRNVLGQTQTAVYSNEFTKTTHNYLTIFNFPYFIQDLSDGDTTLSPTIFGTVTNVLSVTVFETRNVESGGTYGFEIISNDIDVSEDGTWTDGDGNYVDPNPGGGNYKPSDSDLTSVLDKLVQDFDSFFSGTWRHIRQLISSAGKLPSVVVELYSWLPEEYKAVIFSAFGIVMVVAVLKVML